MRDHMPSMIQKMLHLEQERAYFNILSVGSGTGDMDLEILKTVKKELHESQGCHQMKIFNRAIELNKYPCDLYKAAIKNLNDEQTVFDVRQQNFEEYIKEFTMEQHQPRPPREGKNEGGNEIGNSASSILFIYYSFHTQQGRIQGGGVDWVASHPPSEKPTLKINT